MGYKMILERYTHVPTPVREVGTCLSLDELLANLRNLHPYFLSASNSVAILERRVGPSPGFAHKLMLGDFLNILFVKESTIIQELIQGVGGGGVLGVRTPPPPF